VEQFEGIRRDHRDEGLSIRQLAVKYRVHRRTVRSALADAVPPVRKVPERVAPVLGPYEDVVRGWLTADLKAPRKQRHTARRVWQRLLEEQDASVAESSVRAMVAALKVEVGLTRREVMVPQSHPPAEEAEVDFGEFQAVIAGVVMRVWMFCLRLSHSGRAVHIAYANQAQESFLDGHVRAFERLGGVPTGMIRYDNLKPAVIRVALGRERFEHPRFVAMRSHYGYDSFYCLPGIDGAHEKGGVEGEIGRFRRRHLRPVPHLPSMAALNAALAAADVRDDTRRIGSRAETVGAAGAREALLLNALPDNDFDVALALSCRVDAKARVCVRQSYYSVPARYAGMRVDVRLGADTVTVLDHSAGSSGSGGVVATHTRSLHKGTEDLILDHYLEVLTRKPGALAGATALAAARAAGTFTPAHQRFWDGARKALGDAAGTRALVGLLLLHRTLPVAALAEAMTTCTGAGQYDPDIVAVTTRQVIARATSAATPTSPVPLPPHAPDTAAAARNVPSLAGYDDLLTHPTTHPTDVTSPMTSPAGPMIGASA